MGCGPSRRSEEGSHAPAEGPSPQRAGHATSHAPAASRPHSARVASAEDRRSDRRSDVEIPHSSSRKPSGGDLSSLRVGPPIPLLPTPTAASTSQQAEQPPLVTMEDVLKAPFTKAVEENQLDELRRLLDARSEAVSVCPWSADAGSLLHLAAEGASGEIVALLIAKGAKKSVVDSDLKTPLHIAAENGNMDAVDELTAEIVCEEIGMEDRYQMTPFHLAVEEGTPEIIMALLTKLNEDCSSMQRKDIAQLRRGSAMFIAERTGRTDIVDMLKKDNASSGFFTDDDSQMKEEFSIPEDGHQ